MTTITLDRTATSHTTGHQYSAWGPITEMGLYAVWSHEDGDYVQICDRADDAVDLMMELAYS